jgi:hypothetical protein
MIECPEEVIHIKMSALSGLVWAFQRHTLLNHLSQAARAAVLQTSIQMDQMLFDLNLADFRKLKEQASWVC